MATVETKATSDLLGEGMLLNQLQRLWISVLADHRFPQQVKLGFELAFLAFQLFPFPLNPLFRRKLDR